MNKRKIKKMLKKKNEFNGFVRAEGNNGGDFIEIENLSDGKIRLKSGSCCVMSIDSIVPVEFLSAILMEKMTQNNMDIKAIINGFEWGKEFKETLISKVIKV